MDKFYVHFNYGFMTTPNQKSQITKTVKNREFMKRCLKIPPEKVAFIKIKKWKKKKKNF